MGKLFDFILTLIENNINESDELVIYSNVLVNVIQSQYGPFALDSIDMLYHLDILLGQFFKVLFSKYNESDILLGLTSDEGAVGMPQLWREIGYANASVINIIALQQQLNNAVNAAFPQLPPSPQLNVIPSVNNIFFTQIWLAASFFAQTPQIQAQILQIIKNTLLTVKGIKRVWTYDELYTEFFQKEEEERYLQLELFPGRSGQIFYSTFPLNGVWFLTGSNHFTIWDQDHHVPLILYQKGKLEKQTIHEPVWINQLPVTLADILKVARPSAAPRIYGPLPGIFSNEVKNKY